MTPPEKARENLLRRMAERQGLRLVKSGRRDPRALGYGQFAIIDERCAPNWRIMRSNGDRNTRDANGPKLGPGDFEFDIEAVDELLSTGKWKGVTIR
jgi:hypothetical protein